MPAAGSILVSQNILSKNASGKQGFLMHEETDRSEGRFLTESESSQEKPPALEAESPCGKTITVKGKKSHDQLFKPRSCGHCGESFESLNKDKGEMERLRHESECTVRRCPWTPLDCGKFSKGSILAHRVACSARPVGMDGDIDCGSCGESFGTFLDRDNHERTCRLIPKVAKVKAIPSLTGDNSPMKSPESSMDAESVPNARQTSRIGDLNDSNRSSAEDLSSKGWADGGVSPIKYTATTCHQCGEDQKTKAGLETHLVDCDFRRCIYGCGESYCRKGIRSHERACKNRPADNDANATTPTQPNANLTLGTPAGSPPTTNESTTIRGKEVDAESPMATLPKTTGGSNSLYKDCTHCGERFLARGIRSHERACRFRPDAPSPRPSPSASPTFGQAAGQGDSQSIRDDDEEMRKCPHCGDIFMRRGFGAHVRSCRDKEGASARRCANCDAVFETAEEVDNHQSSCPVRPTRRSHRREEKAEQEAQERARIAAEEEAAAKAAAEAAALKNAELEETRKEGKCMHCGVGGFDDLASRDVHESTCDMRRCRVCHGLFGSKGLGSHERACRMKAEARGDGAGDVEMTDQSTAHPDPSMANCIHCGVAFLKKGIRSHERACKFAKTSDDDEDEEEEDELSYDDAPDGKVVRSGGKLYSYCMYCNAKFLSRGIRSHERACKHGPGGAGVVNTQSDGSDADDYDDEEVRNCDHCGEGFMRRGLGAHMRYCKLKDQSDKDDEGVRGRGLRRPREELSPLACSHCERTFPTVQEASRHQKNCDDRKCRYCGGLFNKRGVNTHETACQHTVKDKDAKERPAVNAGTALPSPRVSANGETLYPCRFCGREFGSRALGGHMGGCKRKYFAVENEEKRARRKLNDDGGADARRSPLVVTEDVKPRVQMRVCDFCGMDVAVLKYSNHLQACLKVDMAPMQMSLYESSSSDEEFYDEDAVKEEETEHAAEGTVGKSKKVEMTFHLYNAAKVLQSMKDSRSKSRSGASVPLLY